jgi:hypothetical protein
MSVILTSTGVTFPDSTTQTTAAGAASLVSVANGSFAGVTSVSSSCISSTYGNYLIVIDGLQCSVGNGPYLYLRIINSNGIFNGYYSFQGSTGNNYWPTGVSTYYYSDSSTRGITGAGFVFVSVSQPRFLSPNQNNQQAQILYNGDNNNANWGTWSPNDSSAGTITGFNLFSSGGQTFSAGTYRIYGVKGG